MSKRGGGAATLEQAQGELAIDIPDSALQLAIQYIPWDLIFPDPDQPRTEADAELRASIAAGGIRQAITVRERPGAMGQWMIVDGERRWRGAEGVQKSIPCVVRTDQDEAAERMRTQLVSNTGKELSPLEEARTLARLHAERGGSVTDLAAFLGKPVTTISQRLNLMLLGPWLPLIEKGIVKYSHAAEVLLKYRGCPDAVHEQVIEELAKRYGKGLTTETWLSAENFEEDVEQTFRPHLYPISKQKDDEHPIFETRGHDAECDCGGVKVKNWRGERRHCGNPEWWKPRKAEAAKVARKKAKSSPKKSSQSGGGGRRAFYAPEDAKRLADNGYETPKGYVLLVNHAGQFDTAPHHSPEKGFDPTDLALDGLQLGIGGSKAYQKLYVKEGKALQVARDAWTKRWETRHAELLKAFKATLAKKRELAVRKDSAADVLVALVPYVAQESGDLLEDLLSLHDMPIAAYQKAVEGHGWGAAATLARDKAVMAWARKLDETKAAALLVDLVTALNAGIATAGELLKLEQQEVVKQIQKRKTPWAKPPKAAVAKRSSKNAQDDEDEELDAEQGDFEGEGDDE